MSAITSDSAIKGNFAAIETSGLLTATAEKTNENEVKATVSRKNVATALESSFSALDNQIEGNNGSTNATNDEFAQQAATLQNSIANINTQSVVLDSLSGQIYASAQALTLKTQKQ